jgi:hypothetical protein
MSIVNSINPSERLGVDSPLVSIVIDNYNYAAYLRSAIDSALAQDYAHLEVIVVDDGSTDDSRKIITSYGSRIAPVFKSNGGQASALNAGLYASSGDIILFLDSDDVLLPTAAANVAAAFLSRSVVNVRWPMWRIDSQGNRLLGTVPPQAPEDGDFREQVLNRGPSNLPSSPTSGNAWSRTFLERVIPIPEDVPYYQKCADEYLYTLAPAFGRVFTIGQPQGCYRLHGANMYSSLSAREKLKLELEGYDQQCGAIGAAFQRNGIPVDIGKWKTHSWFHQLDRAISDILRYVPEDAHLVLIEGGTWDSSDVLGNRKVRPFLVRDGSDWGPPPNSDAAIAELKSLCGERVDYLVVGWPSFWWFDEYPHFFEHLEQNAARIVRNDVVAIYRLKSEKLQIRESLQSSLRA